MKLPNGRTLIGEILWFPYSMFAWTLSLVWLCIVGLGCIVAVIFVPFERFQTRGPHQLTGMPMWFALGPVKTIEDPKYSRDVPSMFMQNHVSMLDGCTATASIRVPLCGLENAAHLSVPGYGWIMKCANAIAVDRKNPDLREMIRSSIHDRIARGISVLTFPEGHRTLDGKLRPFKNGVFRMAIESGIPISPIAVRGAYRVLPKGVVTVRPSQVTVYIAPQIETKGLTMEHLPALKERVRTVIEAFLERGEMLGDLCKEPLATPKADDAEETSKAV
ncbi:MAG: lysophospholipid acyltransferase family protein [Myxococcota bacterium]